MSRFDAIWTRIIVVLLVLSWLFDAWYQDGIRHSAHLGWLIFWIILDPVAAIGLFGCLWTNLKPISPRGGS